MEKNLHQTVILIFVDDAKQEAQRKKFVGKASLDFLTQKTVTLAGETGLPVILHSRDQQQGATFGERYEHAIQTAFELGYENVISIGNDTPALSSSHLEKALTQVESGRTVIGKSYDGGFYLLGLNRHAFAKARQSNNNSVAFRDLPWQTGRVLKAVIGLLKADENKFYFLEKLHDLDHNDDVERLLKSDEVICRMILRLLKSLCLISNINQQSSIHKSSLLVLEINGNKGSPLAA